MCIKRASSGNNSLLVYLVCLTNMNSVRVGVAVHGHALDAQTPRRTNNTTRNLTTVGNQNLVKQWFAISAEEAPLLLLLQECQKGQHTQRQAIAVA